MRKTMTAIGPTKMGRKARCIEEVEVYTSILNYMVSLR